MKNIGKIEEKKIITRIGMINTIEDSERIKKMNKNEMIGGRGPSISKREWDRRKAETELIFFINDIVKKYDLNVSDVTKTLLTIFNMKFHHLIKEKTVHEMSDM